MEKWLDENKLDIGFGESWPANLLSNMYPHKLTYDGTVYPSMESFLQSLKFQRIEDSYRISQMVNFEARKEGQKGHGWKKNQELFWNGECFPRQGEIYNELIADAYSELYEQNKLFRLGLDLTLHYELDHTIGNDDPTQTILTRKEFVSFLDDLRERRKAMSTDWKTEYNELVKNVIVLDTETTNIDTKEAEVIELAYTSDISTTDCKVEEMRFKPVRPIPPEAMAVHHITNRMLNGEPRFGASIDNVKKALCLPDLRFYIAHNSAYDQQVLITEGRRESDQDFIDALTNTRWICTWRLAKAVLGVDYSKFQYNLSYLRYALNVDVSDDLGAHSGLADVTVCAKLFETLVRMAYENKLIYPGEDLGDQLYKLCWQPKKIETWPIGKYKGVKLEEIPTSFYTWAIDNMDFLNEEHERYDLDLTTSVINILSARLD